MNATLKTLIGLSLIGLSLVACSPHGDNDDTLDTGTSDDDGELSSAGEGDDGDDGGDTDDTDEPEVDADGDGFTADEDCDDSDASTYPGAPELCDGLDNDCDDVVDEDAINDSTWYRDSDGDGYGDPSISTSACDVPSGFVGNGDDCDDTDASAYDDCTSTDTCTIDMEWEPEGGAKDLLSLSYELDCDSSYEDWDATVAATSSSSIAGSFSREMSEGQVCMLRMNATSQLETESYRVRYGCESTSGSESGDINQGTWSVTVDCGTPMVQTISVNSKDSGTVDGCETEVIPLVLAF
ncbi:hypothetical protein HON52_01500 [Candidatus Uhrbacteria bacterium]|jgi:hypothetical protein|nr:hypothetical protein [Candidatus Uhrbacteria bacterium]